MLNIEEKALKHSWFYWADPRSILITGISLIIAVVSLHNLFMLLGLFVFVLLCIKERKIILKRLVSINIFIIFIWLTVPFTVENGVSVALLYTLRINTASLIFMMFIAPMGIGVLSNALTLLHVPAKLVALLILTYKYIFVLWERLHTSITAMQLRKPADMGTVQVWKMYAALFATAITAAAFRADKIQKAMFYKGFTGAFPLTVQLVWCIKDSVLVLFGVSFSFLLWFIQLCLK